MENEVSSMVKLGVVLVALSVLISLGFQIFQVSKATANTGVTNVQEELEKAMVIEYSTYDQTIVSGQIVRAAFDAFKGEETAILIASQAWVDLLYENGVTSSTVELSNGSEIAGSGFKQYTNFEADVPIVIVYNTENRSEDGMWPTGSYRMQSSKNESKYGAFINYNAILGNKENNASGTSLQTYKTDSGEKVNYMAYIYFDSDCFRCISGFLTNDSGRVQYNNVIKNIQQTGTTEFIPTSSKFDCYLVKDSSGTIMGIACQQISK